MKRRCYCCGEELPEFMPFALVTMGHDEVDRVFIAKPEHVARFDDARSLIVIPWQQGAKL
jgi:hypothetical protein